ASLDCSRHTLQRHCEWWAAKHMTKAGQCHKLVAGDTTPYRCPCVTFAILKLYSL
ncbi:hypothetical protein STEG23_027848, partial [Scotinomys teguina]